jgi:PAS domain S-box-containing protein
MAKSELEQYKETVSARLSQLSPFLQNYALGDFSESIEIPEEEDEFTELLVGLSLMADDIKELVQEKESTIAERKQAEEALRESERRLSTTLRSIGDAVIATDAQGLVTLMNPVAENLTGWDEAEALSKPLEEVFHIINEQTGEQAENPVARVLREGVVVGLANHTLLIAKDGPKRPIADSGAPMRDEEGNIIGTVMVFRDITERRQAEEKLKEYSKRLEEMVEERTQKLQESEEKLRAQYKGIPIPTGTWQRVGEDFVLVDYNDALEEVTQGGIANFVGMKARELYQDRPEIVEGLRRCFAEKTAIEQEMFYQYKSTGEGKYLAVKYAFVPPDLVLVHTEDITARKRAQEALRESKEWLSTTLRSIGDAVIATDAQGVVTLMNPVAQGLTGWDETQALGEPLEDVFHIINEQTGERAENPVTRVLREGVVVGLANHTLLIAKDGTKRPIADSGAPMRDEEGNIIGTVMVFRDITERRQAEEELRIKDNAIASSINAIAISDLQGNLTYVNPAFLDMWGYDDEEKIRGRSALEFWEQTAEAAEVMRLVREEGGGRGDLAGIRQDGSTFDAQLSASLVTDDKNKPLCMMASFLDITERKQAEQALRHSEEQFSKAFRGGPLLMTISAVDDGTYLEVNDNFVRVSGYSREDSIGTTSVDLGLISEKDRKRLKQALLSEGRVDGLKLTLQKKSGDAFHCLYFGESITIAGEQRLLSIAEDISERVRAEETLKRRVAELRALNAMAAIVNESLDVDELLNRAMDEALRLVGVEAAAMLLLDGPSTGSGQRSGQRSGQGKAGELVMAAHRGISDEFARVFSRIKLREGLSGQVAQTGEPVVMGDLSEYPDALKAYLEKERIQSAAFVPLIGSTGVMGTMNLGTANPDYFDAAGLELLMALGGQIAIGVEKLRLYAETRAQAEELRKHRDHLEERVKERTAELQRTNEELEAQIAERVRAEESLRIRDQAITTSITPFAVSDLEGHLTYVNPAFLKLWGYEEEAEVLGEPATDFWLREEDVAEIIAALQKEGFWRGEMLAKRKDGTTFMADISASMVVDATGAPICLASSFVDITDRVQAQEALAQRVEELERFNRLAVGRELRMIELKRQINQLSEQLGKEPPYDVSFAEEG